MEYKCKTISINKLTATPVGFVMPLCQTCKTVDCTNPIEKKRVAVVGVIRTLKIFSKGVSQGFVVKCNGYTK